MAHCHLRSPQAASGWRRLALPTSAAVAVFLLSPPFVDAQRADPPLTELCAGEFQRFDAPQLGTFDRDGNRRISEAEAQDCEILAELFPRLDIDADDALSITEYRAFASVWRRRVRSLDDPER